jgi:hypothetical protein
MSIKGQFLCISHVRAPEVHILDDIGLAALNDRLRVASKRESDSARLAAHRFAFGFAFDYAIPCWVRGSLEAIALDWDDRRNPHVDQIKFLAAAIATGSTFGADRGGSDDTDGGLGVDAQPTPTPIAPSGAARLFDMVQS